MNFAQRLGALARAAVRERRAEPPMPTTPSVVYARVLDGESLWLALTGDTEPIRLRRQGSVAIIHLPNDAPEDPAYTSIRWRLTDLDGHDDATYELVTASGEPLLGTPVDPRPMRTPSARDRRWRFTLDTTDAGALVLHRERPRRAVEITRVTLEGERAKLWLAPAPGNSRLRVGNDAGIVAELPLVGGHALLAESDLPAEPGTWLLDLVDGRHEIPLVRRHNECAQPGRATALPSLWTSGDEGRTLVRLTYGPDGHVRVIRDGAA